jgi:membrane-associated phospholipid phosphatase
MSAQELGPEINHRTKREMNPRKIILIAPAVLIFTVFAMQYVDLPLADWVAETLWRHALLKSFKSDLPDLLLMTVVVMTGLSWAAYFYLTRRGVRDKRTHFFALTGTVLPLSFLAKTILKFGFGRMETRKWLSDPTLYGFHWFNGGEGFNGFPSGHMLVFTPLFVALWHFYPRFRFFYAVALSGLGIALITTNYHFLSDVIAGAYIGAVVYYGTYRIIKHV